MKLARKLTLALVVGVLVIMTGYAWLQIRREVVIFDVELWKNEKFGHGAAAALAEIWAVEGEAKARQMLETIDRHGPDVCQHLRHARSRHRLAAEGARPPRGVGTPGTPALAS